ncbi:MAG: hypothetical protein P1P63_01875 [Treponemataceae bacterium]
MKRKSIFGFGVLIFMISTGVLLMACSHGNESGKKPTVSDLEVKPTEKADSALAGTYWRSSEIRESIEFDGKGNIARFSVNEALYSIVDSAISFDMSKSLAISENITADTLLKITIQEEEKDIADLEKAIKQESDPEKKKKLEEELAGSKEELKAFKTDDKYKKELKEVVSEMHKMSAALKSYAKFSGTFNAEKTTLTIENLPVYDPDTNKVNKVKAVFTKEGT